MSRPPYYWALAALLSLSACMEDQPEHPDDPHGDAHAHNEDVQGRTLHLTPEGLKAARLRIAPATTGTLSKALGVPGRITLDPRRHAIVSTWIQGQVDGLRAQTGDPVTQGQALAAIRTPELGAAVGAYRSAEARHRAAEARLKRLQILESGGVSSQAQVLDAHALVAETQGTLEAAEERLRILGVDPFKGDPTQGEHYPAHVPVTSPIGGEVLQVLAAEGQQVSPSEPLFRVGDISEVWLIAHVPTTDLPTVKAGQALSFTVEGWPDERFTATVDQVGAWVDPATRTVELRARVPNADRRLKPNLFAQVSLAVPDAGLPKGIVLPEAAVAAVEGMPVVFIQTAPGAFTPRKVAVAARAGGQVRLASGVNEGEPVVMEGAFTLKSELERDALGGGHAH